jgi:hypothetical protein
MTDNEEVRARYAAARQRALELLEGGRKKPPRSVTSSPTVNEDKRAATAERLARRLDEGRGRYDADKSSLEDWISECTLNPSGYTSVGYIARLVGRLIALVDKKGRAQQVEWEQDIHDAAMQVFDKVFDEFERFDKELADAIIERERAVVQQLAEDLREEWRAEMRAIQRGETVDVQRGAKFEPKDPDVIDLADLRAKVG